jgi:uncharacterized damage-inducible protein DinB
MINWKEFAVSRIREIPGYDLDGNHWRSVKASQVTMWPDGVHRYHEVHNELSVLIEQQKDELLLQTVPDRKYNFRKLLNGIVQHDIYHPGQIAYIQKLLREKSSKN